MVNELNREIDAQRSQLHDQQTKIGQTMTDLESMQKNTSGRRPKPTGGAGLGDLSFANEEQRQRIIRALASIRGDMVKIAEGNIKAMSEDDKQNLTVQALITNKTSQLQEKIDDYETQIQNLKRELKAQKALAQQNNDQAADARQKLGNNFSFETISLFQDFLLTAQNEKKLAKLQQQNTTLTDDAQRRLTGQQAQQGQVGEYLDLEKQDNSYLKYIG